MNTFQCIGPCCASLSGRLTTWHLSPIQFKLPFLGQRHTCLPWIACLLQQHIVELADEAWQEPVLYMCLHRRGLRAVFWAIAPLYISLDPALVLCDLEKKGSLYIFPVFLFLQHIISEEDTIVSSPCLQLERSHVNIKHQSLIQITVANLLSTLIHPNSLNPAGFLSMGPLCTG